MNILQRLRPTKPQFIENIENAPIWKRVIEKIWHVAPNTTPKYKHELHCVERALQDVSILEKVPFDSSTFKELDRISSKLKSQIQQRLSLPSQSKLLSPTPIFKLIDEIIDEEVKQHPTPTEIPPSLIKSASDNNQSGKTDTSLIESENLVQNLYVSYRLHFAKHYFQSLDKLFRNNDMVLDVSGVNGNKDEIFPFMTFVDSVLTGTSSERIQHHLQLFGPKANPERLIIALYALYEPELLTTVEFLKKYPFQWKKHKKLITKLSNTYLLDKLELNTKARCILAWSDPKYSGFKPLDDDFELSIEEIISGRQQFFPEGKQIPQEFVSYMKITMEELEENKRIDLEDKEKTYELLQRKLEIERKDADSCESSLHEKYKFQIQERKQKHDQEIEKIKSDTQQLITEKAELLEKSKHLVEVIQQDELDLQAEMRNLQREYDTAVEIEKKKFKVGTEERFQKFLQRKFQELKQQTEKALEPEYQRLQQQHQRELQQLQLTYDMDLQQLEQQYNQQLLSLKKDLKYTIQEDLQQQLKQLREKYQQDKDRKKQDYQYQKANQLREINQQLEKLSQQMNEQLSKQRKQYANEIKTMQIQNHEKLLDLKKLHNSQMQSVQEEYQLKMNQLKENCLQGKKEIARKYRQSHAYSGGYTSGRNSATRKSSHHHLRAFSDSEEEDQETEEEIIHTRDPVMLLSPSRLMEQLNSNNKKKQTGGSTASATSSRMNTPSKASRGSHHHHRFPNTSLLGSPSSSTIRSNPSTPLPRHHLPHPLPPPDINGNPSTTLASQDLLQEIELQIPQLSLESQKKLQTFQQEKEQQRNLTIQQEIKQKEKELYYFEHHTIKTSHEKELKLIQEYHERQEKEYNQKVSLLANEISHYLLEKEQKTLKLKDEKKKRQDLTQESDQLQQDIEAIQKGIIQIEKSIRERQAKHQAQLKETVYDLYDVNISSLKQSLETIQKEIHTKEEEHQQFLQVKEQQHAKELSVLNDSVRREVAEREAKIQSLKDQIEEEKARHTRLKHHLIEYDNKGSGIVGNEEEEEVLGKGAKPKGVRGKTGGSVKAKSTSMNDEDDGSHNASTITTAASMSYGRKSSASRRPPSSLLEE